MRDLTLSSRAGISSRSRGIRRCARRSAAAICRLGLVEGGTAGAPARRARRRAAHQHHAASGRCDGRRRRHWSLKPRRLSDLFNPLCGPFAGALSRAGRRRAHRAPRPVSGFFRRIVLWRQDCRPRRQICGKNRVDVSASSTAAGFFILSIWASRDGKEHVASSGRYLPLRPGGFAAALRNSCVPARA